MLANDLSGDTSVSVCLQWRWCYRITGKLSDFRAVTCTPFWVWVAHHLVACHEVATVLDAEDMRRS